MALHFCSSVTIHFSLCCSFNIYILGMSQDRDGQPSRPFDFSKLSRPRQDQDVQPSRPRRDRDVPENVSRPQCRSLKTLTGEVCHLTTCFLQVRYIIFFHGCSQDLKSRNPRHYIFKTETRPRHSIFPNSRDRHVHPSRPRRDQDVPKKRLMTASRPRLRPCYILCR